MMTPLNPLNKFLEKIYHNQILKLKKKMRHKKLLFPLNNKFNFNTDYWMVLLLIMIKIKNNNINKTNN